jgi:hypothetical protein
MGRYSLRDGKISAEKIEAEDFGDKVKATKVQGGYVMLDSYAPSGQDAYLYIGSAKAIMISSTLPDKVTGTVAFENKGFQVGTVE